jgi:Peptidase M15
MTFPAASDANSRFEEAPIDRRRVIGGLGLAGLGLLASSASASAFTSGAAPKVTAPTQARSQASPQNQRIDLTDLNPDWARSQGSLLPEYTRYLWNLKLKNISPAQVITAHAKNKGSIWNTLPPKSWWTRMGYTLRVADRIAQEMNVTQVEVISAYRSPAYNAHCEGAKARSWHQANVALDVKFPVRASQVTATARNLRDRGLFKGGVGGYWDFTHIDTRGENVNW